MRNTFTLFVLLVLATSLYAQKIKVSGQVLDDDTQEPIPFSNIYLDGTTTGVTTDMDGYYTLEFNFESAKSDSLVANSLGYRDSKKAINKTAPEQTINFKLKSADYSFQTVEVKAGENPANEIVRQIVKHKKDHDLRAKETYKVEQYSKVELDLDNISEKMQNGKMLKDFKFVFDNIDSVSDVEPFLPAYVAERLHDIYWNKAANDTKEMLKAQKVSGITNQSVVEFINTMHERYNVYENWINILGKEFVSPFSSSGLSYYEYYILDSTVVKGHWSYKLKFKPRRKQENTFYGDFWVAMDDYAVEIVNMRMSPDVNINLVNRVVIYAEFEQDKDSVWLPVKEKTVIDFSNQQKERGLSIIGRTTYSYKNYEIETPNLLEEYKKADPEEIKIDSTTKDESFWETSRHEALSKNEQAVYKMVDSIKNVPIYKTWSSILTLLGSGYQVIGPIEIGEYWDIWTYNRCEGYRIGMGIGTSNNLSKKIRAYGYAGYGFTDKRWKYRAEFMYVFNREKRIRLGATYRNTITFENVNSEETPSQSLFAGWLRRPIISKIMLTKEAKIFYQHGWKNGIQTRIAFIHRQLIPQEVYYTRPDTGFSFVYQANAHDSLTYLKSFTTFETVFRFRFAYKERLLLGNFSSISLGSKYPILVAQYTWGQKGVLGSQFNYHKISLSIDDWFNIGIAGWIDYHFEVGKVFGNVPYLFMKVHPGNEAYMYNVGSFNSMNNFEFVSDTYLQWRIEHHLDGLLLDKIPLIRKLKWRNVWAFRGVWGTMSQANADANRLNNQSFTGDRMGAMGQFYGAPSKIPYMEVSAGIENIFKVLRVDALWRLTYRDNPNTQKFSVRLTLSFNF